MQSAFRFIPEVTSGVEIRALSSLSPSFTPALPNYVGVLSCRNIPGSTAYEDILYTSTLQFGRLIEDIMCCGHLNIDVFSLTIATIPHET